MDQSLDPYSEWLQIPPGRRPPSHYDLLGLAAFESDGATIENAALGRYKIVHAYQVGKHERTARQLLLEITRAKDTLTSPERKIAYDEQLRSAMTAADAVGMKTVANAPAAAAKPAEAKSNGQTLVTAEVVEEKPASSKPEKQGYEALPAEAAASKSESKPQAKTPEPKPSPEAKPATALTPPASPLVPPAPLGADDWTDKPDRKHQLVALVLGSAAVLMLLGSAWWVVNWFNERYVAGRVGGFASSGSSSHKPSQQSGATSNSANSTTQPGGQASNGNSGPVGISPPGELLNPPANIGTVGAWTGTLSHMVGDQSGLHMLVDLPPDALAGVDAVEVLSAGVNLRLQTALADYLTDLETQGKGDKVLVRGRVVAAPQASLPGSEIPGAGQPGTIGQGPMGGVPAGPGFTGPPLGTSGAGGLPGGLPGAASTGRLAPEAPLVELLEIERVGDAASRVGLYDPAPREPASKLGSSLLRFLRYRPYPTTSVKFEGYVHSVNLDTARFLIKDTLNDSRHLAEVRIAGITRDDLASRAYTTNDKVVVEGTSAADSTLGQWIVNAITIVKASDPYGPSLVRAGGAATPPSPTGIGGAPVTGPPPAGRSAGPGQMAGNFRAEETAWRQMARSVNSKIGQRYSSKARFASFQRIDPQVIISVRFETETASFTAKHTPALLNLLGKLKWDQPVEFEVLVGGGTDYYPQCWLLSLGIAGDAGSRVSVPANLPLVQIAEGRAGVGVAWRSDGGQFVVGGNRPAIYEATDGKLVSYLPSSFSAAQLKWSPDGLHLAAITSLNQIKLWNIDQQADLYTWSVAVPSLHSVAFTPVDGRDSKAPRLVAVAGTANPNAKGRSVVGTAIEVYDLAARKPLDTITGSSYNIAPSALDWSPQGRLAIGTRTQGVFASQRSSKMSDVKTPLFQQQGIEAIRWLPANHLAAAGSGMLQVWDLDAIKPGQPMQAKHTLVLTTPQFDQAFSHDDRRLVANLGGEVRVWNLVGGATVKPRTTQPKKTAPQTGRRQPANTQPQGAGEFGNPFGPFGGFPGGIEFPPGGLQPGGFGGRAPAGMGVPQQDPGTPLSSFAGTGELQPGMRNGVTVVAWCPAGDYVAAADYLGQIVIVNVTEDEVVLTLGPAGPNVASLSWSPRGDRLVSTHSDGAVRLWDTSSLPMEGKPAAIVESPALAGNEPAPEKPPDDKPAAQQPAAGAAGPVVQRKEVSDLVNKALREINAANWEAYHATLKQIEAFMPNAAEIAAVNRLKTQFASKVKDAIRNAERQKSNDRSKYLELLAKAAEMDPDGPDGDRARKLLSDAVKSGR